MSCECSVFVVNIFRLKCLSEILTFVSLSLYAVVCLCSWSV